VLLFGQQTHDARLTKRHGDAQHRTTQLVARIDIGAVVDEQLRGLVVPVLRRTHQRRRAKLVSFVDIGAIALKKSFHQLDLLL